MTDMPVGWGDDCNRRHSVYRLVTISAVTLALYLATWPLERAIFYNGATAQVSHGNSAYAADPALLAWQMAGYVGLTAGVFWAYLALVRMCRRGELDDGRMRRFALCVPVVLNLVCLMWVPRLSQDTLSYLGQGLIGLMPDHNPLLQPVEVVRHTDAGARLTASGWLSPGITPYGILWTRAEMVVARYFGDNVFAAVVAFKAIAAIASLGTARMIWLVLGRTSPALQLQGTLAYLWNPLVIMEFAGEGHNDAVMIFFSIAAVAACIAFRPTTSIIAQLLGVMTKYVSVLFLPAQLCYLWRTRRTAARLAMQIATAVAVSGAIAAILYAPLWAGLHTFDGVLKRAEPSFGSATLFGATAWFLRHSPFRSISGLITTIVFGIPMLAWIAWSALRVRDATDLARTCAWISLAFVLVVSPDYWPWYACISVAWIAVGDLSRLFWLAFLMSMVARLVAPLEVLHIHEHLLPQVSKGMITGLGTLVPLLALGVWCSRQWQREHTVRNSMPTPEPAMPSGHPPPPETRGVSVRTNRNSS